MSALFKTGEAQGERMLFGCPRRRTSDLRANGYLIVGLCFVCAILLLHFSRKDHTLFRTSSADWVLSSRLALRFRGMLLEPRLHLAGGLEGLAQLRLIDGVDIVILDSA